MINTERIKQLLEFARENGVSEIECDGVKFKVGPKPEAIPFDDGRDIVQPKTPFDDLNDEDVLFWSTPTYDELQTKKQLQEAHAKETQDVKNG